jgi:hypothetical protein
MKIVCLIVLVMLSACEDRYRYACQNPENWELDECKPPICTASGTCPEQLVTIEKEKK